MENKLTWEQIFEGYPLLDRYGVIKILRQAEAEGKVAIGLPTEMEWEEFIANWWKGYKEKGGLMGCKDLATAISERVRKGE